MCPVPFLDKYFMHIVTVTIYKQIHKIHMVLSTVTVKVAFYLNFELIFRPSSINCNQLLKRKNYSATAGNVRIKNFNNNCYSLIDEVCKIS